MKEDINLERSSRLKHDVAIAAKRELAERVQHWGWMEHNLSQCQRSTRIDYFVIFLRFTV